METEHYDDIIIGSGKAGKTLAPALVAAGRKTALVERSSNMIGGGCINIACIPTKTMVASANVANIVQNSSKYGVEVSASMVDLVAVIRRKRSVVKSMHDMNLHNLETALGHELIIGTGRFVAPKIIEVIDDRTTRVLTAERFFINTGTHPLVPPVPGLKEAGFLTSESLLELEQLPEHLIVLGSGYIGLEFAQMFRRFGCRVTVLGQSAQILSQQDPDMAIAVQKLLERDGIEFLLKTKVLKVDRVGVKPAVGTASPLKNRADNATKLQLQIADRKIELQGSHLLVAVGREPTTDGLSLAAAGVTTDVRGFIQVNDRLETNVPGIWALGDINGGPEYTHVSLDDCRIIKANLIGGGNRSSQGRLIPSCLYIDPELAHVGLTETAARQQGYAIRVMKLDASAIPRAITLGKTDGLLKAIVDTQTDRILGCSLLCHAAGETISTVQMVMQAQMPYTVLRDGVLTHPTMTEGLNMLFSKL